MISEQIALHSVQLPLLINQRENDGAYTRMLRTALNVSWKDHISSQDLYCHLPKLSYKIREKKGVAGHCVKHKAHRRRH